MSRIALIGENSPEYISNLLDIWNSGNCVVLIDWRVPLVSAAQMMIEARVVECRIENKLFNSTYATYFSDIRVATYSKKAISAEYLSDCIFDEFKENYSQEEAVILYSSGTTGNAKGIILTHFAINTNADAIIDYMHPLSTDCIYLAKTLSHSSTLIGELLVALKSRMKLVIANTIVPPRFILGKIAEFNVSIICLNPTLASMLADEYIKDRYDLTSLNTIYISGAVLTDQLYKKLHTVFKDIDIFNVYGLSEAGPRVAAQRADCCASNSVGTEIQGVELRIINDDGTPVLQGEKGVLHIQSQSIFKGYVKGDRRQLVSRYNGWLNTGDIAFWDEHNELHIVGRADDIIILESHKIYPSDVEQVILSNSSIDECIVSKVEYDDKEILCCLYSGECIAPKEIRSRLRSYLTSYEIPRRFIRTERLPKTVNGKVSKIEAYKEIQEFMEFDNE